MHFKTALFITALAGFVAAAPSAIEARSDITVLFCQGSELHGPCVSVDVSSGSCSAVPAGSQSAVPSGTTCTLYSDAGCSSAITDFGPGVAEGISNAQGIICRSWRDAWGGWGWW